MRSVVVTLRGDVVRVEPTLRCVGADRDARALGLFFASGDQHFEHRVISRHEAPNAYSADEDRLGDAVALEGGARFPARVKVCSAFNGWR